MKIPGDTLSIPRASESSEEVISRVESTDLPEASRTTGKKHLTRSPLAWVLGAVVGLATIGAGIVMVREHRAVESDAQAVRNALAAGRAAAAREPLRRWLSARPRSAEAHALLAEVLLADNDFPAVKREYNEARSLGYPEAKLERIRGIWWARLGRFSEAEPILYQLWTNQPKSDPAIHEALARIYLKTYRLRHAQTVIEHWIADAPADGRPFLWLTEIDRRTQVNSAETWERHYREALSRDPELDAARLGLAEALRKVHRNQEAAEEYTRYLARHPDDPAGLAGAGMNAIVMGDPTAVTRYLDRALALAPHLPVALKARAEAAMHDNDPATARRWLDQAVEADRFDDEAYYARARVRKAIGDTTGAAADIATFNRLKREQEELLKLHTQLLTHPEDSDTRSQTAAWLFAHGRDKDALEWATAILANDPHHAPTCRLLADYYDRRPDGAGLANFYRLKASSHAVATQ